MIGSAVGSSGNFTGKVTIKSFPGGENLIDVEYPFRKFLNVLLTSNESSLVCCGVEKTKTHLLVFSITDGSLVHKILHKYSGLKEITKMVALPDKPGLIGLIDSEKGNIMDIVTKKFLKSIQWQFNL